MKKIIRLLALACALCVAWGAAAQSYPTKPIRMILAFPPGGPTDINARIFALKLGESMNQQIVVDNKAGAGGNIGATEAAKAPADGYTIFYNTSAISIAPALYSKLNYDVLKDYAPVALTATVPLVLVVNPALPVKSVQELVAYAKANPGKVNYGSSGSGTITHLASALFGAQMGLTLQHIPYRGSAPALVDVAAGQTQMMIDTINTVLPYVKDNRLRALAIAIPRRSAALPEVPTLEEAAGLPGFEMSAWQGIVVPAATPKPVIAAIHRETVKAVASSDYQTRVIGAAQVPISSASPEEFQAYMARQAEAWAKVIKPLNLTLD